MTRDEISAIYGRFGALVHRRCRRILKDEAAAEDATQETFLRLWRHTDSYERAESKLAWLYRVAERCAFDLLRSRRRLSEVPFDEAPISGTDRQTTEDWDVVRKFLARLDDRLAMVAVLHYLDGETQDAIAAATGWSRQTVIKKLALLRTRAEKMRLALIREDAA
jgi:RNA polymerase sigma factor (sigma-70 family)